MIWPEFSLNDLVKFQIFTGNPASLSALQSVTSENSSTYHFPNVLPNLDQALSGARLECGQDFHKLLIEFGGAAKVWMTVQVEYEPVNPLANKQTFEQYLSDAPTRMFRRDETISAFENPYIDSHQILTDRIKEFNAKFIRDKSVLRLARVLQFTLKMVKYAPLEGRGWQPLPQFLSKKKQY